MHEPQKGHIHKSFHKMHKVCPWWLCFTFDNPLRRIFQNPERILKSYVVTGWTCLDVGPGMGYFTIPMARLVGSSGKVIAADLQPQMLEAIRQRAVKAKLQDRILLHQSEPDKICISEPVDFCLAFWMVHEVPDQHRFLTEITSKLKPGGLMLIAEPNFHVTNNAFEETIKTAESLKLNMVEQPKVFFSHTALLRKGS